MTDDPEVLEIFKQHWHLKTLLEGRVILLDNATTRETKRRIIPRWMVLKGKALLLFDGNTTESMKIDHLVDAVSLGKNVKSNNIVPGFSLPGFGFEIESVTSSGQKKFWSFLFKQQNDRDYWMAFVDAISLGVIPKDLNLLHDQTVNINQSLSQLQYSEFPPPLSYDAGNIHVTNEERLPTVRNYQGKELSRMNGQSHVGNEQRAQAESKRNQQPLLTKAATDNPWMYINIRDHPFYRNLERNVRIPLWFIHCTRETAETVLYVGRCFGNVLMRPTSTNHSSNIYSLSYRDEISNPGISKICHFSIIPSNKGFKINVEDEHMPMCCLSDVMEFFVKFVGPGAQPFKNNDLNDILRSGEQSLSQQPSVSLPVFPLSPPTSLPQLRAPSEVKKQRVVTVMPGINRLQERQVKFVWQ